MKRILLLACVLLSLSSYAQGNGESNITCRIIQMATDGDYLWLACDGGLMRYNKQTGKHTLFTQSNSGLCSDDLISVTCCNGKVLTGSQYDGFSEFDGITFTNYNMSNAPLETNQYCKEVLYDSEGNIWLGALDYIYKYDGTNWEKFTLPNAKYSAWLSFGALKLSADGTLWFGTGGPNRDSFGYITKDKEIKTVSPDMVSIHKIDIDKQGNVWYCSEKGIACYDGNNLKYYNSKNSPIVNDLTYGLSVDDDNNIWFASDNLLFKYDGTEFTSFQVPTEGCVFDLLIDGKAIWVAITHTGELFRFEDGKFESVDYSANTGIEEGDDSLPQNDYIPFVESGKIWHVVRSQTGYLNYHFNQYTLMNEEVVKEGKTYLKMYRSEDGKDVAYDEGLYREEDRRVYVYDEKDGREYMLYDFSLKEGDTFTYEYGFAKPVNCKVLKQGWLDDGPKIVTSRTLTPDGTMESKYRQLRTWTIGREDDSGVYYEWGTWVEGVGVPEEMFKKLGADGVMSCLAYIEREENKCDYSENAYLPFSFYDYWGPVQGFNLPKGAADYSESDGHHQLTYELEGDRLHVHGKVFTQCGPNSYAYFIAEPIDNSPVIKLRFEIQEVEPLADCMGLFDIDFYVPGFEQDFGYLTINAVVDNQGVEHPVIKKTQQDMPYRPMIEDGKVWKVGALDSGNPMQMVEYYYFDGDTIIDGKACKQMMRQRYVNPNYINHEVLPQDFFLREMGAWYEEDKKVYAYNTMYKEFRLMYDFSLNANDTLQGHPICVIGPRQTEGIKGFKGVYRKIMDWIGEKQYICDTWLEGVGHLYGPTGYAFYEEADYGPYLMSCTVGDEVIYFNDDYEDGATPAEARKRRFDFTHTIKIQPKARHKRGAEVEQSIYGEYNDLQLGINLDPLDDAYLVRITDESGKAVYEKNVNTGNIVGLNIDISNYAEGRYTVTVENSLESFTGEFEAQTTGIKEVRGQKSEVSGHIYNLQGQRISTLQKGLNIVNGQKVFVK